MRVVLQTLGILLIAVIGLAAVIGSVLFQVSFVIYLALLLTVLAMVGIVSLCWGKLEDPDPH
jgi:hypothetical protein